MALPGDSITITPGAGATVATETVNAKEYQVVMRAAHNGHILKTLETYYYWSGINVGAQNKIHLDLFNAAASGKLIRVRGLYLQCGTSDVDNGVTYEFDVDISSAVGTGFDEHGHSRQRDGAARGHGWGHEELHALPDSH
jgi:hypothetical protein